MLYEQQKHMKIIDIKKSRGSSNNNSNSTRRRSAAAAEGEEEVLEIVDLSGMSLESLPNPSINLGAICKLDLSNNDLQVLFPFPSSPVFMFFLVKIVNYEK